MKNNLDIECVTDDCTCLDVFKTHASTCSKADSLAVGNTRRSFQRVIAEYVVVIIGAWIGLHIPYHPSWWSN